MRVASVPLAAPLASFLTPIWPSSQMRIAVAGVDFIEPCLPSPVAKPPRGSTWLHVVRKDGRGVRVFTRRGHDWTDRFPAIVDAACQLKARSFLIDGEA